jgi:hypothetical protein
MSLNSELKNCVTCCVSYQPQSIIILDQFSLNCDKQDSVLCVAAYTDIIKSYYVQMVYLLHNYTAANFSFKS